jgi:predicted branched-subunit amino acid permease
MTDLKRVGDSQSSELAPTSRARVAPLMLGVVPFGFIFGITVNASAMPPFPAQATSSLIFAGSSQLIFARLVGVSAPWVTIVLTAAVINLRHVLYSASIAPYLRGFSSGWKAVLAYLLTDEAYAIAIGHFEKLGAGAHLLRLHKHWYFFGVGATLWACWQMSTLLGIFVGGQVPAKDRAGIAAALVAGVASVAVFNMPLQLSLVIATLLGIAVGYALDRKPAGARS